MSPAFNTPVSRGAVEGLQLLPHYHQPLLHVQQSKVQVFMLHGAVLTLSYFHLRSAAGRQMGTIMLMYAAITFYLGSHVTVNIAETNGVEAFLLNYLAYVASTALLLGKTEQLQHFLSAQEVPAAPPPFSVGTSGECPLYHHDGPHQPSDPLPGRQLPSIKVPKIGMLNVRCC